TTQFSLDEPSAVRDRNQYAEISLCFGRLDGTLIDEQRRRSHIDSAEQNGTIEVQERGKIEIFQRLVFEGRELFPPSLAVEGDCSKDLLEVAAERIVFVTDRGIRFLVGALPFLNADVCDAGQKAP